MDKICKLCVLMLSLTSMCAHSETLLEKHCTKFEFEEKVLEKLVKLEFKLDNSIKHMEESLVTMQSSLDDMADENKQFKDSEKEKTSEFIANVQEESKQLKASIAEKMEEMRLLKTDLVEKVTSDLNETSVVRKEIENNLQVMQITKENIQNNVTETLSKYEADKLTIVNTVESSLNSSYNEVQTLKESVQNNVTETLNKYEANKKALEDIVKSSLDSSDIEIQNFKEHVMQNISGTLNEFELVKDAIKNQVATEFQSALQKVEYNISEALGRYEGTRLSIAQKDHIAFVVHTPESTSLSSAEAIKYDTVVLNMGKAYDTTTGKMTAPYPGTYFFSVQMCGIQKGEVYYQLLVNNVPYLSSLQYEFDRTDVCSSVSTVAFMKKGDTAWVKLISSTTISSYMDTWTMFTGALVNLAV